MTEIIKKWLGTRLGIVLDMDPERFGAHVSDGTLLARLLHSYDVINAQQLDSIIPTDVPKVRYRNMSALSSWLNLIGITCNDTAIREISEGKGIVSIRLFYNIFLNLENKDILDFLRQQLKRETAGAIYSRFEVDAVKETDTPDSGYGESFNELALPLIEKKHMIDWHRVKIEKNIAKCKIDERFLNFCGKPKPKISLDDLLGKRVQEEAEELRQHNEAVGIQNEIEIFHKNNFIDPEADEEFTYDELLKLQVKALEYDKIGAENNFYSKEMMEKLKTKARKTAANRQFKFQMQNMLLDDVWNTLLEAQEAELDEVVIRKLLKQSQYEKQMATRLFQVRNEKKVMAQNRILVNKLLAERREEEFAAALQRNCDEFERSRMMNQFLDEKMVELHKRIYAEKQLEEKDNIEEICAETVDALIDLSVKTADYKNENNGCIPKKLWDEWKVIFFHSQPIFDVVDGVENTLDEDYAREMEEIVQVELERQEVLNDHDIYEYLHLLGPWLIEELCPEIGLSEGDQIVLGYVVHKLLDVKYPLPSKLRPIDLPHMEVAAMVVGINDQEVIKAVEELISYRDILVITLESAINYCLEQFKLEMAVVTDIDLNLIIKSNATVDELKKKKNIKIEAQEKGDKKAAKNAGKKAKADKASKKKSGKSVKSSKSKEKKTHEKATEDSLEENDKNTQTPRRIPDDDPLLTPKAELGKRAFEVLTLGEQIPDHDLVAMLAEYLKVQENMEGWVIFNYPLTYSQAQALEEVMGGKTMPGIIEEPPNLMEIIQEIEPRTYESEESLQALSLEELRTSKLVPNPHPKPVNDPFKTYFTAYINAKKAETPIGDSDDVEIIDENSFLSPLEQIYTDEGINYAFYYRTFDFETIKKLARLIIGDMQLPLKPSVELFGEDLDELEMKFGVTDAGKIGKGPQSKKKVNKEVERVEIVEVVEEPVVVEEPAEEEKKGKKGKKEKGGKKDKKGKKEKGDKDSGKGKGGGKKDKKGKKGKGSETTEETEQGKQDDATDTESHGKKEKGKGKGDKSDKGSKGKGKKGKAGDELAIPDELLPKPGEDGWVYANLSQPEILQHALATLWENLEQVYLDDFKQIFFLKRIHYSMIMPYCNYIKNKVLQFSQRPDKKQEHVFEFLAEFNEIDEELRTDVEIKSEIYCRTKELQNVLWNICDTRKLECEQERQTIIGLNWVAEEMCYLTNVFMEAIQLESDRCVDTIQLLHDYYFTMLSKVPAETRLEKIQISRLDLNPGESVPELDLGPVLEPAAHEKDGKKKKGGSKSAPHTSSKHAAESTVGSHKSGRERATMMKQAIETLLCDTESSKETVTPFHDVVTEKIHIASNYVETLKNTSLGIIKKEGDSFHTKGGKGKKGKEKGGKKDKGKKSKSAKSSKSGKTGKSGKSSAGGTEVPLDEEQIIREASKRLVEEWEAALLCEANRVQFRLQLLKARAMKDLWEILNTAQNTFFGLSDEIEKRFEREVEAVNLLCKVICRAIEDETQIQHELVLEQDRFYVREDVLLFPDPPPPPPVPVEEKITDVDFTVAQLTLIMEKLFMAAPSSWLPERAFVYMLADMALCGTEEGDGRILPKIWSDLTSAEIPIVVDRIFNDLEFVDWKDFLIHALDIGFPSEREILNLRHTFRRLDPESQELVLHDEYFAVNFWYEAGTTEDPQQNLRLFMAKEFLFTLFQVGDNSCNYTALLLYFCKDDNPKCGFAKSLALATGKRAVIDEEEFLLVQDEALGNLSLTSEEIRLAAEDTANIVLEEVLEEAIQQVAGFVIKEILSEVEIVNHDDMEVSEMSTMHHEEVDGEDHVEAEVDVTPAAPSPSEETVEVVNLDIPVKRSFLSLSYTEDFFLQSELGDKLPFTLYVTFEVALNVLTVSLPWHDKLSTLKSDGSSLSSKLRGVFDELAPDQPSVLAYQLFQHPVIEELLQTVNKFKTCHINDIITDVINSRVEESLTKVFSKT